MTGRGSTRIHADRPLCPRPEKTTASHANRSAWIRVDPRLVLSFFAGVSLRGSSVTAAEHQRLRVRMNATAIAPAARKNEPSAKNAAVSTRGSRLRAAAGAGVAAGAPGLE